MRTTTLKRHGCLTLLAIAVLTAGTAARAAAEHDAPEPGWRNGPVRFLLTAEEDKAYRKLKTDEERTAAVEEFWKRRDPTPGTPENEFRTAFFRRVSDAEEQFREPGSPGWSTDRGRMLLVAGYPAERSPKGEDAESWSYSFSDRMETPDLEDVSTEVTFTKNEEGAYRMDPDGSRLLDRLRQLEPRATARASLPRTAIAPAGGEEGGPVAPGQAPAEAAPAGAETIPPGVERLREAAEAAAPAEDLPVSVSVRTFKSEDGSTFGVFVLAVPRTNVATGTDGKPATLLYARISSADRPGAPAIEVLDQELFTLYEDAADDRLKHAFSISLRPGRYELRYAASDGAEGRIGSGRTSVTFPDFTGEELMLSSVTLASHADPAPAGISRLDPFLSGALRLIPRAEPRLGPGDELAWFYDVYNARLDPETGKPTLEITYGFEKKEAGAWKPMQRNPLKLEPQHEQALGYTIPADTIAALPPGDWRVLITVRDSLAGKEAKATLEFAIVR